MRKEVNNLIIQLKNIPDLTNDELYQIIGCLHCQGQQALRIIYDAYNKLKVLPKEKRSGPKDRRKNLPGNSRRVGGVFYNRRANENYHTNGDRRKNPVGRRTKIKDRRHS